MSVRRQVHSCRVRRSQDRSRREARGASSRRADNLLDDLQFFLGDLCIECGFCNALADDIVAGAEPLTADAFATAVLTAEGWPKPDLEGEWRTRLKQAFFARYGAAVSESDFARGRGSRR